MGLKSIDMRTGEVRALTTAPTSVNLSTGKGTNYKTTWKKIGSALKKARVKTGYRYDPKRYPNRKQTRTVVKPKKAMTKRISLKIKKKNETK